MGKTESIYVKVASGTGRHGGPWTLLWPAWRWSRLTKEERQRVVADQARAVGATVQNGTIDETRPSERA